LSTRAALTLLVALMVAVIVAVDLLFFRNRRVDPGRPRERVAILDSRCQRSRSASGIFSWISGGSDVKSVAQVWRQFAHVSIITVVLFTMSKLPTC